MINNKLLGQSISPKQVADLIGFLGAKLEPERILDPACGMGVFISSFLEYNKSQVFIKGIDINTNCVEALKIKFSSNKNVVIETEDSIDIDTFEENECYNLIMCEPPFGQLIVKEGKAQSSTNAFLEKCLSLLCSNGFLLFVTPEGFLFRSDKKTENLRKKIINDFNLTAIFSLPTNTYLPYSSVKTSILFIQNSPTSNKPIIFGNFKDKTFIKEDIWECIKYYRKPDPPLFFIDRKQIGHELLLQRFLPIEQKLKTEDIGHPLVHMSEIFEILPLKNVKEIEPDTLILRRVGNFKIVSKSYLESIAEKTARNNYSLLKLKTSIDLNFLKMIFSSNIFNAQIEQVAVGSFIRSISKKDISDILIPLPPIQEQKRIAEYYSKLEEIITNTTILKEKVIKNPFSNELLADKTMLSGLERFSDQTINNTIDDLPAPIAMIVRQTKNINSGKTSLDNSIGLFESLIKYMTILLIMESYQRNLFDDISTKIKVKFIAPSIGIWFNAFKNIVNEINNQNEKGDAIKNLMCFKFLIRAREIIKIVEDSKIISIRNDYLGHPGVGLPDEIYKIRNSEVKKVNDQLLTIIAPLIQGQKLLYLLNYRKRGNKRFVTAKFLMGENRDFLTKEIEIPIELETEKVLLVSNDYTSFVTLDPLLHFGVCPLCGSENLFFYDKRDKEKIKYLSYLHPQHKPTFDLLQDIETILPFK